MFRTYDLSGIWDFSMAQMAKGTFPTAFDDTIALPGTTSLAKKGAPNPNREAGFLTDAYAFEGQAWFRKEICIDPELFMGEIVHLIHHVYRGNNDGISAYRSCSFSQAQT